MATSRKGAKDSRTQKQKNRAMRQEELREMLAQRCRLQHILDNVEKLEDLNQEIDPANVHRIKTANEQRLKLLNKYMPDLRSVEMKGEDGGPVEFTFSLNDSAEG